MLSNYISLHDVWKMLWIVRMITNIKCYDWKLITLLKRYCIHLHNDLKTLLKVFLSVKSNAMTAHVIKSLDLIIAFLKTYVVMP